jgi:hypothetical protein
MMIGSPELTIAKNHVFFNFQICFCFSFIVCIFIFYIFLHIFTI